MGSFTERKTARSEANTMAQWAFATEFLDWTPEDAQAIRETVPLLGPYVPGLLDALFDHLLNFADTAQFFTRPNGSADEACVAARKKTFGYWLTRTVSGDYGADFVKYVGAVGRAHTSMKGDPNLVIPRRLMTALIGWLEGALLDSLFILIPHDPDRLRRSVKAWHKMLSLQLFMFVKSYPTD